MCCQEVDFAFIENVGQKVNELLMNDANQVEWFNSVIEEYNLNGQYPPDLISEIIDYLTSADDEYYAQLAENIQLIIQDEDNIENLLGYIYFPATNEEEDTKCDDNINSPSFSGGIVSNDQDDFNEDESDSKAYFRRCIKKIMQTFHLSHDISYVLCKKFRLNQDKIISNWISSKDEILKSLRIQVGSEMVPDLKSPLSIRKYGIGECPICYDETELFELYCGHKTCQECLIADIKQLVTDKKTPVCRQTNEEDNTSCNALIIFDSVKNFLREDDELFESFEKIVFDNDIITNLNTKQCPNEFCDGVITPLNELACHVGVCPKCGSAVCLKCNEECHGPFSSCSKIKSFMEYSDVMKNLSEEQYKWLQKSQRITQVHSASIKHCYSIDVENLTFKNHDLNKKLKRQINYLTKAIKTIQYTIEELQKNEEKNHQEIEELKLKKKHKETLKEECKKEIDDNNNKLSAELELLDIEQKYLLVAFADLKHCNRALFRLEMEMNKRALEKANLMDMKEIMELEEKRLRDILPFNKRGENKKEEEEEENEVANMLETALLMDSDNIKSESLITSCYKRCPRCTTPIEKTIGCNHMNCQICNCYFCYNCGVEFDADGYCGCGQDTIHYRPPQSNDSGNFGTRMKIPHNPMDFNKRVDYLRYSYCYANFQKNKKIYSNLFSEFKSTKNKKPEPGTIGIPDSALCARNRIARVLLKNVEKSEIKMKTYRIMNVALFAQSVIMWSFPTLYYIGAERDKENMFSYKLNCLQDVFKKYLKLIEEPKDSFLVDFERFIDVLLKQIKDILVIGEAI